MKGVGVIYAWLVILAMVFISSFLWIIFSEIHAGYMFPWAEEEFNELNATGTDMSEELTTLGHIQNYWNYWPLLLLFGLTLYGLAASLKREPGESGY